VEKKLEEAKNTPKIINPRQPVPIRTVKPTKKAAIEPERVSALSL